MDANGDKGGFMRPESKTAYFCCGARMVDAQSTHPVCNDTYAKVFMKSEGREVFERFKPFRDAMISNATRHRIIDDLLREELKRNPERLCIIIGAGFDTRAYRLRGGTWIELDDPELIEYKSENSIQSSRRFSRGLVRHYALHPIHREICFYLMGTGYGRRFQFLRRPCTMQGSPCVRHWSSWH
jgi:hypothetical protein